MLFPVFKCLLFPLSLVCSEFFKSLSPPRRTTTKAFTLSTASSSTCPRKSSAAFPCVKIWCKRCDRRAVLVLSGSPSFSTGNRSSFCSSRDSRTPKRPSSSRVSKTLTILPFQKLQLSSFLWLQNLLSLTGFLVFVNLYCVKYGAIALQEIFDDIQPK